MRCVIIFRQVGTLDIKAQIPEHNAWLKREVPDRATHLADAFLTGFEPFIMINHRNEPG